MADIMIAYNCIFNMERPSAPSELRIVAVSHVLSTRCSDFPSSIGRALRCVTLLSNLVALITLGAGLLVKLSLALLPTTAIKETVPYLRGK